MNRASSVAEANVKIGLSSSLSPLITTRRKSIVARYMGTRRSNTSGDTPVPPVGLGPAVLATLFIRDGCGLPTAPFGSRGGARPNTGKATMRLQALRGQAAALVRDPLPDPLGVSISTVDSCRPVTRAGGFGVRMPNGVAALAKPRALADRLRIMAPIADDPPAPPERPAPSAGEGSWR